VVLAASGCLGDLVAVALTEGIGGELASAAALLEESS
jgi:hypothetical protein